MIFDLFSALLSIAALCWVPADLKKCEACFPQPFRFFFLCLLIFASCLQLIPERFFFLAHILTHPFLLSGKKKLENTLHTPLASLTSINMVLLWTIYSRQWRVLRTRLLGEHHHMCTKFYDTLEPYSLLLRAQFDLSLNLAKIFFLIFLTSYRHYLLLR